MVAEKSCHLGYTGLKCVYTNCAGWKTFFHNSYRASPLRRNVCWNGAQGCLVLYCIVDISLSKHMGDGKEKLGRGPYAIFIAILSMPAGFQHPRTKYMLAPGLRKLTFLCGFSCGFAKWSIWTTCHITYNALNLGQNRFKKHHNML